MDAWHAAETANSTFVVCHDGGVSEVDVDGRLTRVCQYDQFEHPCHLAVADGLYSSVTDVTGGGSGGSGICSLGAVEGGHIFSWGAQTGNRPKENIDIAKHRTEPKMLNWIVNATQRHHCNDVIVLRSLVYVTKERNCKP